MTNVTGTLNRKITHKINPIQYEQKFEALSTEKMFAALDAAYEELIAEIDDEIISAYIYSNVPVLKFIAPVMDIIIVDGTAIIIEETRAIPVNVCGMTRQEITQALIMAVKKGV